MRGPDRRRSPPPPHLRRDDRRGGGMPFPPPPPPPRGRRGRSPSPPMDRFRRSPPPKRFRRDEPYDRFGPPPPRGYDEPPPFDRRGPPMGPPPPFRERYDDGFDDRYREPYGDPYRRDFPPSPPPPRRTGPMTYKELMRELPDDITPEDAQAEYQVYLARWWGSEVKAEFESRKNDEDLRRRFDPREHQKAVQQRNKAAEATARSFLEDWADGKIDPAAPDFNQGNGAAAAVDESEAEAQAEDKVTSPTAAKASTPHKAAAEKANKSKVAPEASWQPARISSDLALVKQLASKLDAEKGITDNSLLADSAAAGAAGGASPDGTPPPESEANTAAAPKEEGEGENLEQQIGRLDVVLTYLWRVHGVDYYSGAEVSEPEEEQRSGPRPTLRCPCPEEGEQADEADQRQQAAIMEKGVDSVWRARLAAPDPFQLPLKQEQVDKHIEEWIDGQIIKIDDKKWGSKVSQKLFVDRAYVVKHIRNKHPHLLDAERNSFYDELYFQNFKEAKEEEERVAREEAEAARAAQAKALAAASGFNGADGIGNGGAEWGGDTSGAMDVDGKGLPAASGAFPPEGLPAPFVGGSPAGMMAGGSGMMNVPAGMVLVPAPGAGPLGPFIPVPMEQAGGGGSGGGGSGMMGMGMRGGRGMGGRGMGIPGRGMASRGMGMGVSMGVGRGGGMQRAREYVDLDDPANQRSVLDYGDL